MIDQCNYTLTFCLCHIAASALLQSHRLKEQVPDTVTFSVGYFEGAHSKVLLTSQDDLHAMYSMYASGPITLWCDGRVDEGASGRTMKRKREETCSRRQDKENEVDDSYQDLTKRHGDSYSEYT